VSGLTIHSSRRRFAARLNSGVRRSKLEYQRARLQYQFMKLEPIRKGIYPSYGYGGNVEFELFSFFEICHHLRDWIKESDGYESLGNVDEFIKKSPALRISADICNRLKHKVLRDKKTGKIVGNKWSDAPLGPINTKIIMTIGPDPDLCSVALTEATVHSERGEECCFALAKECIEEWERYFSSNKSGANSS